MSLDERLAAALRASPELCSLNMGSMNFGMYPMLERYPKFQHDWERPYLESTRNWIFRNTFGDHRNNSGEARQRARHPL